MVAQGAGAMAWDQAVGDLLGQRPGEFGAADAVPQAVGTVRGLVGAGAPIGVLPTVPQQVEPERAVLVGVGAEVEWGVAELLGGDSGVCLTDDLVWHASGSGAPVGDVRQEGERAGGRDEEHQRPLGTVGHLTEVRCYHQAKATQRQVNQFLPIAL